MRTVDRDEAIRAIERAVSSGLGPDLQKRLSRSIVDVFEGDSLPPAPGPRYARLRHWVIRDEDLDVTRSVTDAVASLVAAQYLVPTSNWAPVTALVVNLLRLARTLRQRGVMLDHHDLMLTLAVRARPGITTSDLASLAETDVVAALRQLSAYPTPAGDVVALIQQAGDGGWHSAV